MFDVIVSGAGPSGSKCAEVLSKAGFKVALIERDVNWRKPCGGGCSGRLYKYFPQLKKLGIVSKHSIEMYSADFTKFAYTYKNAKEYSFVMDRLELDNLMRNVAVDAGAQLFDKSLSYDFVVKRGQKLGVKAKSKSGTKEFLGKLIVIADGISSKLALKSNLRPSWNVRDLGLAKCAIMEGKNHLDVHSAYFYFQPYYGYGWIFPISKKRFNMGVITFYEDNLNYNVHELFKKFLNMKEIRKMIPTSNYVQIWTSAFPEPANGVMEKCLYRDNVMLVGDAAGFVSPISGEGIYAAVVSGQIAAETALNALKNEEYSGKALKSYKLHPNIKKIVRNYKLKRSFAEFFYAHKGNNLNVLFNLAEEDPEYKRIVADTFLFNKIPPKDFFSSPKFTNSKIQADLRGNSNIE